MESTLNQAIANAVIRLLRPLVRLLLRNGIPFSVFSDLAKWVYVDVAEQDFKLDGRKQTKSRISVLTGLSRKEVLRIKRLSSGEDTSSGERYDRVARVISGWRRDHRFASLDGSPANLPIDGDHGSFAQLAKLYSGDIPYRALLDELERMGLVVVEEAGTAKLQSEAYLPQNSAPDQWHILGDDVALLLDTLDFNLKPAASERRLQRKVAYDNLPLEVLPKLKALSRERGQALLEEMDQWLAQHDRDTNPNVEGTGKRRAGIGIYYFEEDAADEESKS